MFRTAIRLAKKQKGPRPLSAQVGHASDIKAVPFVRLPPSARVFPLGTPSTASDESALLKFPSKGWTINDGGKEGWAILGDAEGRKLAVEVGSRWYS